MAHTTPPDVMTPSEPVVTERPRMPQARAIRMLVLFYLLLLGLNILRVFVLLPWEEHLNDVLATFLELIDKASIWIGLTYLFVVYGEKRPFLTAVQLKGQWRKGVAVGLFGSLIIVLAFAIQVLTRHQSLHLTISTFFAALPVFDGLIEEIPFRGFLQQHLQSWMPLSAATLLNALLFVGIHIPIWLSTGLGSGAMIQNGIRIFILAIFFCIAVRISRSLWSSVLMHTVNNLISLL